MLRELLVSHFRQAAVDFSIVEVSSVVSPARRKIPSDSVLLFLSASQSGKEWLEEIRVARKEHPSNPVAVISNFTDQLGVSQLLELGVKGFLSTTMALDTLVHSLRVLVTGGEVIPRALWAERGKQDRAVPEYNVSKPLLKKALSAKELKVLYLVQQGKPNKVIAAELNIEESVVKNVVRSLMRKTDTRNRVELALDGVGWMALFQDSNSRPAGRYASDGRRNLLSEGAT